jgi:PilZ domain
LHNNPNRREFTRVSVQLEAEVTAQELSSVQGHSCNVSLNGVFLHCDTPFPVGTTCCVTLRLADHYDDMGIAASGRVVRLQDEGMAIMFTEILGLDSFNHLRNLVLSNSIGATEQIEKEFRTHVGIKRWAEQRASVAD